MERIMAESSIFWTTGSTGDGASPYTQAQILAWLLRTFLNDPTTQGVLYDYADDLVPAGSVSPVTIGAGAAMVCGIPYESTAQVEVTIPTPTIGTTGHRIVLRADWTAQTVRVELKSSSDGVASIPALTQTADDMWEISLATLTITTGGAITLTDTRAYIKPNIRVRGNNLDDNAVVTAKIAANAVTTAKVANNAIDDTKAGSRVPVVTNRQGGSDTDWGEFGNTNYSVSGNVLIQAGSIEVDIDNGSSYGMAIGTFPIAFGGAPLMVASSIGATLEVVAIGGMSTSATQFTIIATQAGTSGPFTFVANWIAIGPKAA